MLIKIEILTQKSKVDQNDQRKKKFQKKKNFSEKN